VNGDGNGDGNDESMIHPRHGGERFTNTRGLEYSPPPPAKAAAAACALVLLLLHRAGRMRRLLDLMLFWRRRQSIWMAGVCAEMFPAVRDGFV
jgi:hypothetical protein